MKKQNDLMLDAALNYIKNNATGICVCNAQPTTYAEAITTFKLAIKTGLVPGDFVLADGVVNGRRVIIPAEALIPIDASGNATHVALVSGAELLYVTTCTLKALTIGNTVTIPTWNIEISDAT
jgi:hypothetical protein